MPQEKPFAAMVMSIIAGSSTIATSIISMQRIGEASMNTLLVHVDAMLVGLTTGFMVVSFGFAMFSHQRFHAHGAHLFSYYL